VKFYWSQKFELGGALAGGPGNQAIARQALPGIGTSVADGNYVMLMQSPLNPDIQPSQPNLAAQPPFGDPAASRRDLRFGFDVVDTLSGGGGVDEVGDFTVDRIEIREYDMVDD
jgi:hypothetical protein